MPESFVNQATARCSVEGSKFWFNCNPQGPTHWFKVNWIDKCIGQLSEKEKEELEKENAIKNIIYLHFTMDDNPSLDQKTKDRYMSMFTGVFYQRYILGLWVAAEGIIYPNFNKKIHTVKLEDIPKKMDAYYITSDYGITNPQVFLLCGIKFINSKAHVYILDEYYNIGLKNGTKITKTDALFLNDYIEFTKGIQIKKTIIDPSAKSLINLFKQNNLNVKEANNDVIDGINVVLNWLDEARIHIVEEKCPNIIKEFFSYIWDQKSQERGKDEPVKKNDHALDALRYLLNTLFPIKKKGAYFYNNKEASTC